MEIQAENTAPALTTIGIDIGKDLFHVVGFDADGRIAFRRKIKRLALADTFEKLPRCVVGMEACLSAHFVSRTLRQLGHEPRIIPAIYVKPLLRLRRSSATSTRHWQLRADTSTGRTPTAHTSASRDALYRCRSPVQRGGNDERKVFAGHGSFAGFRHANLRSERVEDTRRTIPNPSGIGCGSHRLCSDWLVSRIQSGR
jgi:hypothetical protein